MIRQNFSDDLFFAFRERQIYEESAWYCLLRNSNAFQGYLNFYFGRRVFCFFFFNWNNLNFSSELNFSSDFFK